MKASSRFHRGGFGTAVLFLSLFSLSACAKSGGPRQERKPEKSNSVSVPAFKAEVQDAFSDEISGTASIPLPRPEAEGTAPKKKAPIRFLSSSVKRKFLKYEKKGKRDDPEALFRMALMCEGGNGIECGSERTLSLFTGAAKRGYTPAQYRLAHFYMNSSTPYNFAKAYLWMKKAAEKDDEYYEELEIIWSNMTEKEKRMAQKAMDGMEKDLVFIGGLE